MSAGYSGIGWTRALVDQSEHIRVLPVHGSADVHLSTAEPAELATRFA